MKEKEKAKELVNKMKLATDEFGYININTERHKQCALIAVDELIEHLQPASDFGGEINKYTIEYWEEVKQEIEKL